MIVTIVTKGSSSSGNFGHAGRPGKVGGSSSVVTNVHGSDYYLYRGTLNALSKDLSGDEWSAWDTAASDRMAAVAEETKRIYGDYSHSENATLWTQHPGRLRYGANKFTGEIDPNADVYQKEILVAKLVQDEVLYRGVFGTYANELMSNKPGDDIILTSFSSTSRSRDIANVFMRNALGVMLVIHASKGKSALYVHDLASELILPAYAKLKVLNVNTNTNVVEVEYIGVEDSHAS